MVTRDAARTPPPDEGVVAAWEAHLAREEALIAATLDSLRGVHAAIIAADWVNLPALLDFQERLSADAGEVARSRESLRERTGVPASATLRALASSLPPAGAAALLEMRDRLADRLREAEALRRAVATLVRFSLGFHQKLLEGLAGGRGPDRYSAAGTWRGAAFGSLIQARG